MITNSAITMLSSTFITIFFLPKNVINIIAIIIILHICNAVAQERYNIKQLIQIAEQNSGNIQASQYFAESQLGIAKQQKYWNNPTFSYEGSNTNEKSFNIGQTIPFIGKLQKKYNIEESDYRALVFQQNNVALLVKAQVFSLAYMYYGVQQKISLLEKRLSRLETVNSYLSNIKIVSPTQHSQAYIVQDKIALLERDLINLQNILYQTWNKMNVFLSLNEGATFDIQWHDTKPISNEAIIDFAIENNLDLKQQEQLLNKYKNEVKFASIEQMPDLYLTAGQSSGGISGMQNNAKFGISTSIPLFNRNQAKVAAFQTKVKGQQIAYNFLKNQIINSIKNNINEYETLRKIATKFPIGRIDIAISRLNTANTAFQKGILDFITYIELDSQEYEVINTVIDIHVSLAITYAQLMIARGEFILNNNE